MPKTCERFFDKRYILSFFLAFLFSLPSNAQSVQVSSGTGFFVSYDGHIITNAHVVKGCTDVVVRGTVEDRPGTVMQIDETKDLALIHTDMVPPKVAYISTSPIGSQKGDKVMVIGYPGDHGISGKYAVAESEIIDTQGPAQIPDRVQFASSAMPGNSGGPLLDVSGNVVGVVVAKIVQYRVMPGGKHVPFATSDLAINLPLLMQFMDRWRVPYQRWPYVTRYSNEDVEKQAAHYVVNIHCPLQHGESERK